MEQTSETSYLEGLIDQVWEEGRDDVEAYKAVERALDFLDRGTIRVAEKIEGSWQVNQWVKKAVLLSFKFSQNQEMHAGPFEWFDKVRVKTGFRQAGVRSVPLAMARHGSFIEPDVVHFHSIQNMGVGPVLIAKKAGIPVVITVHDNWWVCERQFMINHAGRYCHQEVIDLKVCRYCVLDVNHTKRRDSTVRQALNSCDLVLYPSQFHHDFHVANGIAVNRSSVNKNGIVFPDESFSRTPNPTADKHKLRFGFVGGPGPIKGASIMARAFKKLKRSDYEVKVVNAAVNTGETWALDPVWKDISGTVTMTPPYSQETIDDFFGSIDVLLFPSQWKESFGLTVREALARDVWVVVTDSGGTVEDCIDGENSTIIPMNGNHDELMNAINDLLDNYQPQHLPSDHITTIAQQAEELNGYLRKLV